MTLNLNVDPHTVVRDVWNALDGLTDPEIPVVTLREMGIIRDIERTADNAVVVVDRKSVV